MGTFFEIRDLNFSYSNKKLFNNFKLTIKKGKFISIIGSNNTGKTTLVKILCAIIPTNDLCSLEGIRLNKESVLEYITKIGIVFNELNNQFLFSKVKDELAFPLSNLGYSESKINKLIEKMGTFFEIKDILNKKICHLDVSTKKKLLIVLALIHSPSLLILDDAFMYMTDEDQTFMLQKLKELNTSGLTILNVTSKLDTIYDSDMVHVLKNGKINHSKTVKEILEDEELLRNNCFEVPFVIDLSSKLKKDEVIDKIYFNLNDLVGALWK